jgi:predicted PurR-regulated permease PerM
MSLPQYQSNIQQKIRSFRSDSAGEGVVERASEALKELSEEIEGSNDDVPGKRRAAGPLIDGTEEPEPIPVQIREPELAPLQLLQSVIGPLIGPLATGGVVIVFVIFMLLQREDLRDRFIRLAGASDLHRTTQALSDAANRVARYLLMQLIVNATYGIPVGLGLWLIGVPNPLLWGLLATVLRFVPYIGPVVAAILPLALSVAVDPGWTMLLWTAALFIFLEVVSNNIVEPWLYGSSTGLSPVAIIVAAIFWTWLWGPIGLLLSTPLTVCLVVLGRHVPQFGFLDVLLGSEPVLTPVEGLYQRLLAGDPDEATERAEEFLERNALLDFYDGVAIPALALVENDRVRGVLDDKQRAIIAAGAVTLVDNLSEHEDEPAAEATEEAAEKPGEEDMAEPAQVVPEEAVALGRDWLVRPVLCAGGRGNLDDAAAAMLGQLVERGGIGVRRATFDAMASANYASLDLDGVQMICLSYMNADSLAHARYLVRRLRRRTAAPILVGFWSMEKEEADRRDLVKATRADYSAISLEEAITQIRETAGVGHAKTVPTDPPLRPDLVALTP